MLSKYSVKKPYTIVVILIIIAILGGISFSNTTVDLLPNTNMPMLVVATVYAGEAPETVEKEVTEPIEATLSTIDDLKNIRSMSQEHISLILLELDPKVDLDSRIVDIREKLNFVSNTLPKKSTLMQPMIIKADPNMLPILTASLSMQGTNQEQATKYYNKVIQQIESTEGVASVTPTGMVKNTIFIRLSEDKLKETLHSNLDSFVNENPDAEMQISQEQLNGIINQISVMFGKMVTPELLKTLLFAQNLEVPAGNINENGVSFLVQVGDKVKSYEELKNVPLVSLSAQEILLNFRKEFNIKEGEDIVINKVQLNNFIDKTIDGLYAKLDKLAKNGTISEAEFSKINVEDLKQTVKESVPKIVKEIFVVIDKGDSYFLDKSLEKLIIPMVEKKSTVTFKLKDISEIMLLNNAGNIHSYINGQPSVMINVNKQPGYSTADISTKVNKILKDNQKQNGFNYKIIMDQGNYVNLMVDSVLNNLLIGAGLALLILFIFMNRIKPTLIVGMSIVASIVTTFVLMYFSGVTLNMLSMGGLALAVGMLVDNSIVVIENIYRMRAEGESAKDAAIYGAKQVTGAIFASTLTTILVFLPVLFYDGLVKQICLDMAKTIGFSLLASLFFAITFVPMASSTFTKNYKPAKNKWLEKLTVKYKKSLNYLLNRKWIVLSMIAVLLTGSICGVVYMDKEFVPPMYIGSVTINAEINQDNLNEKYTYDDALNDTITTINDAVVGMDIVDSVGVNVSGGMLAGYMGDMGDIMAENPKVIATVLLKDLRGNVPKATKEIEKAINKKNTKNIFKAKVTADQSMDMTALTGGAISLELTSVDLQELRSSAEDIEKILNNVEGVKNVKNGLGDPKLEYKLVVDKEKASKYGLTVGQVYMNLSKMLKTPSKASDIMFKGDETTTAIYIYPKDFVVDAYVIGYINGKETKINIQDGNKLVIINDNEKIEVLHDDLGYYYNEKVNRVNVEIEDVNKIYYKTKPLNEVDLVTTLIPTMDILNGDIGSMQHMDMSKMDPNMTLPSSGKPVPLWYLLDDSSFAKNEGKITYRKHEDGSFVFDENGYKVPKAIKVAHGAKAITRLNGVRWITVSADLAEGYSIDKVKANIEKALDAYRNDGYQVTIDGVNTNLQKPDTVNVKNGGQNQIMTEVYDTLLKILILGIVFIYLVMVAQFQSLKSPFIVMMTIPLAFIGSVLMLLMCNMSLSVVALIGMIMLVGIVVNNGIVFVDYANQLVNRGIDIREALLKAGTDRLRPILMTALTTIFALIAMAADGSIQGVLMRPMAVATIGGMLFATLLTLYFIPIVYEMMNKYKRVKTNEDKKSIFKNKLVKK